MRPPVIFSLSIIRNIFKVRNFYNFLVLFFHEFDQKNRRAYTKWYTYHSNYIKLNL